MGESSTDFFAPVVDRVFLPRLGTAISRWFTLAMSRKISTGVSAFAAWGTLSDSVEAPKKENYTQDRWKWVKEIAIQPKVRAKL